MRKRILPLALFIISGLVLAYMTCSLIFSIRGINGLEDGTGGQFLGLLQFSWIGVGAGFMGLVILLFLIFLGLLWAAYFLIWLFGGRRKDDDYVDLS